MTTFSPNQQRFASALTQATGLDPNAVKAWMVAEEPAGANAGYRGTQDWLNIGITDSGPLGSQNSVWQDPVKAAQATANWMKGTWADPGFGTASPEIQSILKTVGRSPQEQLTAIANSPWASSHYGGPSRLISLLGSVQGVKLPNVGQSAGMQGSAPLDIPNAGPVKSSVQLPMMSTTPTTNLFSVLGGLEGARQAITGQQNDPLSAGWDSLAQLYNQSFERDAQQQNKLRSQLNGMTTDGMTPTSQTTNSTVHPASIPSAKGIANFEGTPIANWISPILQWAKSHGWNGSVTSGYRSLADQTRIYNSGVRPAAKPGTSNHEFTTFPGGAVDVSEAAQLSQVLANSPYRGLLVWAGAKDPVHFSHPHGGSY